MDRHWMVLLIATLTCISGVRSQTIQDVIKQRPELNKLKIYMERLNFYKNTLSSDNYEITFFAPMNEAFDNIPAWLQIDLSSTSTVSAQRVEPMFMNHAIIGRILQSSDIADGHYNTMASGGPFLFTRFYLGAQFVNGARMITKDLQCSNGVIHIIDTFLYEPASPLTVMQHLTQNVQNSDVQLRTSKFVQLLNQYMTLQNTAYFELQGSVGTFVTVFAPSDEYLGQLSNDILLGLERNVDLKKVIDSHIIISDYQEDASSVYHSKPLIESGLNQMPIDAREGTISITSMGSKIYVSNNCAQGEITGANITVDNGVIHMINGLLGYLFYDAYTLIQNDAELDAFEMYVMQSGSITNYLQVAGTALTTVAESDKITIFAPDEMAFSMLSDWQYDISSNRTHLDMVLHAIIIPGVVKTVDMTNGTVMDTMQPGVKAKFYQYPNGETFVEIDHVIAKIARPDFCVRNGVVHYVDRVPATPYKTILEEISSANDLVELYSTIRQAGLDQVLADTYTKLTFFAPTNDAFVMMRAGSIGRAFLNPSDTDLMRELVKRHYIIGELYLDTITTTLEVTSEAGVTYTIRQEPGAAERYTIDYDDKIITVLTHDMKMTNGVLHIIDSVIYKETPIDLQLVSASVMYRATMSSVLLGICLSCLAYLVTQS